MVKEELRKLFFKNKSIFLIVIAVSLQFVLVSQKPLYDSKVLSSNIEGYRYYTEKYVGRLTTEKELDIEQEYQYVINARYFLDELFTSFKTGKITEEEYVSQSKPYLIRIKNTNAFKYFYEEYKVVKENSNNRYILDQSGWNRYFQIDEINYVLLLLLIFLFVPVFCKEYESDMVDMILSSKNGRKRNALCKFIIAIFLTSVLTIGFTAINYLHTKSQFPLSHGDFPIQSLNLFTTSNINISINALLCLSFLMKLFGGIILAGFVFLFSTLTRKSITACFFSIVIMLFPNILLQGNSLLYQFPFPSSLYFPIGYFKGNEYKAVLGQNGWEKVIDFKALTQHDLIIVIVVLVSMALAIYIFTYKKFNNKPIYFNFLKKIIGISCFCIMLVGCKSNVEIQAFVYDGLMHRIGENTKYSASIIDDKQIVIKNKKDGNEKEIITDPLFESNVDSIFINENYCYYATLEDNIICFYQINLETLHKELIFNESERNTQEYFGLLKNDILMENRRVLNFFVNESNIYYYSNHNELFKLNFENRKIELITNDVATGTSNYYYNGDLVYINLVNQIVFYDTKEKKFYYNDNIYTEKFILQNDELIYYDLLQKKEKKINVNDLKRSKK